MRSSKYTSYNPYVDAIFYRVTHNIADVPIEHFKREYGSSNYTFRKLVRLWLAYFNFSTIPLRISSFLGILFSVVGFIGAVAVIIRQLIAPSHPDRLGLSHVCYVLFLWTGYAGSWNPG